MLPTIPDGFTADFEHTRRYRQSHPNRMDSSTVLDEKGGSTRCDLLDAEGNVVATGIAVCYYKDNFSKSLGRTISLGRALKEYNLNTGG